MEKLRYIVRDSNGLHARPAWELSRLAATLDSKIVLERKSGERVDCKSLFSVMSLGLRQGDCIRLKCCGAREQEDIQTLAGLCDQLFERWD